MKHKSIFITGTDTGVGKTLVTGLLARYFHENGERVITQKWVQTGCRDISEDIEEHIRLTGATYKANSENARDRAPYILSYPASPHLASKIDNITIEKSKILDSYHQLSLNFDRIIIEGSGGVLVPFNEKDYLVDLLNDIDSEVILVAENRLGAINQTLLSIEALKNRGLTIRGIIFNNLTPGIDSIIGKDNLEIINSLSGVPVLGELPFMENIGESYNRLCTIGKKIQKREL